MTAVAFTACNQEDDGMDTSDETKATGTANIAATDAAIDAENVTGVYLAVTGFHVDGDDDDNDTTVMLSSTQEFNLMAYQNGDTYDLGSIDLGVGSYSGITFILDEESPAYVEFDDNTTAELDLESDDDEYEIIGDFEIEAESQTDLVADVDLRKAFHETSTEGEFMLRSTARLVRANIAGTIQGSVENFEEMQQEMEENETKAKLVVFAYAEGTFDESEMEDQDGDGVEARFENAVNSAVVTDDGDFTLAFMEESDYEIVVGVFEKDENAPDDEEYDFSEVIQSELSVDGSLDILIDGLGVNANSSTDLSIKLGLGG